MKSTQSFYFCHRSLSFFLLLSFVFPSCISLIAEAEAGVWEVIHQVLIISSVLPQIPSSNLGASPHPRLYLAVNCVPANFVFLAFLLHCLVTTHHFLLLTDSPQAESFLCLILLFSYLWNLTQQLVPPTHPVKPQRSSIEAPASVAPLPVSHLHSGIYHKDLLYL